MGRASWSTRASTSRSAPDTSTSWGHSVEAGHVHQLQALGLGRTRRPRRRSRGLTNKEEIIGLTNKEEIIGLMTNRASSSGGMTVHQLQALGLGRTRRAGVGAIVGAASRAGRERLRGSSPPRSTGLDKIFDQALILWCGMVTCGRAESPVLGRDMGALGSSSLQPTEPMEARGVSSAAPKVAW